MTQRHRAPGLPAFRDIKHSDPIASEFVCLDGKAKRYVAIHRLVASNLVVQADGLVTRKGVTSWRKIDINSDAARTAIARAGRRVARAVHAS